MVEMPRKLTIAAILWAVPMMVTAAGGPKIKFDKTVHDYGKIQCGKVVEAEFPFTNMGDAPLLIKKLRATCGCTKAVHGSRDVPPKGTSKIVASFDTRDMRAGRKRKMVHVHTNDPKNPIVSLRLYADVVRHVTVEPRRLAKSLPGYRKSVEFSVTAKNTSNQTVTLQAKKVKGAAVQAFLAPQTVIVPPASEIPFKIRLDLKEEPGRFHYLGRLLLKSDLPEENEVGIQYMVTLGES